LESDGGRRGRDNELGDGCVRETQEAENKRDGERTEPSRRRSNALKRAKHNRSSFDALWARIRLRE
jgi:hypothetical protein